MSDHSHHPKEPHVGADDHVPNAAFDPNDPHGIIHAQGHGHVIVSAKMLIVVLTVLLVFTVLTVFLAQAEKWFSVAFGVDIPQSVNVAICMSIATVKSIMVGMFFMQLKYDNKLHSLIMAFCLLAFGLFLGFTALDLGSRGRLDPVKEFDVFAGGTGKNGLTRLKLVAGKPVILRDSVTGEPILDKDGKTQWEMELIDKNITQWAKETAAERLTREGYEAAMKGHHGSHDTPVSSANRAVAMYGPRLFATHHDDDHSGHTEPGHAEPGHAEPGHAEPGHADPAPPEGGH